MNFEDLQERLVVALKLRLQNGDLTERRLAHLTGISQPHVHNVLKGARILSPVAADRILRYLRMSLLDLATSPEIRQTVCRTCSEQGSYREVPILEGWLGPGLPLPTAPSPAQGYPFPSPQLLPLTDPTVARLALDQRMTGVIKENDLALLDRSPHSRLLPHEDSLYVVSRHGEGLIRRLRMNAGLLYVGTEPDGSGRRIWRELTLDGHILDVVKARVVWIGRFFGCL